MFGWLQVMGQGSFMVDVLVYFMGSLLLVLPEPHIHSTSRQGALYTIIQAIVHAAVHLVAQNLPLPKP